MSLRGSSALVQRDSAWMYVAIWVSGTVNGVVASWIAFNFDIVILNLHAAIWTFLVVWAATTTYVSYKHVPSGALATGLIFGAVIVFLIPFLYYGPVIIQAHQESVGPRGPLLLEGFQGLIMTSILGGSVAFLLGATGVYLRRRARHVERRTRSRRARREASSQSPIRPGTTDENDQSEGNE